MNLHSVNTSLAFCVLRLVLWSFGKSGLMMMIIRIFFFVGILSIELSDQIGKYLSLFYQDVVFFLFDPILFIFGTFLYVLCAGKFLTCEMYDNIITVRSLHVLQHVF